MEVPLSVARKSGKVHAALKEELCFLGDLARLLRQLRKRVLKSVVNLREHARTEFGGKKLARELDRVVDHEVGCRVEYLHVAARPADADNLGHEALAAADRVADFVLGDGSVKGNRDHVAVDADDFTGSCHRLVRKT